MIVLLSPSKGQDFSRTLSPSLTGLPLTEPRYQSDAGAIAAGLAQLSEHDVAAMMKTNERIAAQTLADMQAIAGHRDSDGLRGREATDQGHARSTTARAALLAYAGEQYKTLDAPSLSADDLLWTRDRVRILSGLYGILRPLDRIRPYRLEMQTRIAVPGENGAESLYAFWRERITRALAEDLSTTEPVLDLASGEYSRAVDRARLGNGWKGRYVSAEFREYRDGRLCSISAFAKQARGRMTRWIIENRIDDPDDLRAFAEDGYALGDEHLGAEGLDRLVFVR